MSKELFDFEKGDRIVCNYNIKDEEPTIIKTHLEVKKGETGVIECYKPQSSSFIVRWDKKGKNKYDGYDCGLEGEYYDEYYELSSEDEELLEEQRFTAINKFFLTKLDKNYKKPIKPMIKVIKRFKFTEKDMKEMKNCVKSKKLKKKIEKIIEVI